MCGIAGMVTEGLSSPFVGAVEKMVAAMVHRGPDSNGVECLGQCLVANVRLAIVDLSERGKQPLCNEDGSAWITYNGECYNAAQLREMLAGRGHRFRSATDTEVALHLYEEFGERCVERMRGMFAFGIWDVATRKLVLARDRVGIKPLYYAITRDGLIFASEIKALLASGLIPPKVDPAGLRTFLQLGHVPPPWTAIQRVKPLEPGHVGVWQGGRWSSYSYWSLSDESNSHTAPAGGKLAEELGEVFLEAMRNHLVSDVPIVLFLSGGIDSACLAVMARRVGAQNLTAMTVGFREKEFDESELSRRTANALNLPHRIIRLPATQTGADLDHAIWACDQPTVDGLNSYWISRLAAEAGFKVALSGQGGDELFGGYRSLAWFERFTAIGRWLHPLPAKPFCRLFDQAVVPFRWRKLCYLFEVPDPFIASQLAVKVLFPARDLPRLLAPEFSANGHGTEAEYYLADWAKRVEKQDLRERIAFMDFHTHLQPRLLRDMDAMSMAHSLEVRPVFLDHRLLEFLLRVPSSVRIQRKRLLIEATKPFMSEALQHDLLTRKKRTFTFPFVYWLSRELRGTIEQTFAPERLRTVGLLDPLLVGELWQRYQRAPAAVGWSRVWSLFVLQRWCEIQGVTA